MKVRFIHTGSHKIWERLSSKPFRFLLILSKDLEDIAQEEDANGQRKGDFHRTGASEIFGHIVKVVSNSKIFFSTLVFPGNRAEHALFRVLDVMLIPDNGIDALGDSTPRASCAGSLLSS
jgi:hypothetical protein